MKAFLVTMLGAIGLCVWVPLTSASRTQLPALAEIENSWRDRQDRAKSFRLAWDTKRSVPKGTFDDIVSMSPGGKKGSVPPKDTIFDCTGLFLTHGSRFRFDIETIGWSGEKSELVTSSISYNADGETATMYIWRSPVHDYGTAQIEKLDKSGRARILKTLTISPILLALRGMSQEYSPKSLRDYDVTKLMVLQGRPCVELMRMSRTENSRDYIVVDRERDFIPVKLYTTVGDVVTTRVDIAYEPDATVGWVPSWWECVLQTSDRKLLESYRVIRTNYEINPDLPTTEFALQFSPGTHVVDATTSGKEKHSVVRPDGSPGNAIVVGPGQRFPTYEELVQHNSRSRFWSWWVWILAAVVIGLGLLLAGRRKWLLRRPSG